MRLIFFILLSLKINSIYCQEFENLKKDEITIYPNPASNEGFWIKVAPESNVKIFSLNGTYIGTWKVENEEKIKIDFLPIGCYEIIIEKNTDIQRRKVIVI